MERPFQFLSVKNEFDVPFLELFFKVPVNTVVPGVPDDHRSRAVVSFRYLAFEVDIIAGMIFRQYRQPLYLWIYREPLGHCPRLEETLFGFQPEIVVKPLRIMLLNYESQQFGFLAIHLTRVRFWRFRK